MPLPLIAVGAMATGVAFSVGTGYLVDRYVFKSPEYTRGETVTDRDWETFPHDLLP